MKVFGIGSVLHGHAAIRFVTEKAGKNMVIHYVEFEGGEKLSLSEIEDILGE